MRIANRVNNSGIGVVGVDISSIIIAVEILIKIFFYCFLVNRDLVINLLFFYESLTFIYFLEYLRDCCFVLDKIYTVLLYLDGFLNSENSISDLLLLLLLLLYFLSALIILLIIIISVIFRVFSFFGKALA